MNAFYNFFRLTFCSIFGSASLSLCCDEADESHESLLSVKRIFSEDDFAEEAFGPAKWLSDSSGYVLVEESKTEAGGKDLIFYSPEKSIGKVMVSARHLIPHGEKDPIEIEDYEWSENGAYLLIYTNSRRVWREKTRGDYWIFDVTSHELKRLGGDALPSTLQFAKFSPVDHRVAYVRNHDIYVEDWKAGQIIQLTKKGSDHIINGTFDWVYEEEFRLRDGIRWSPDGSKIAYWQINTEGVGVFYLIDNLAGLYPRLIPISYPKVGETNPSCRIGWVSSNGGKTRWMPISDDPRNHYIASLDWMKDSSNLVFQLLNRLQNTNRFMIGNVVKAEMRTLLTDSDQAWVEVMKPIFLKDGEHFLWQTERDGWRHLYLSDLSGKGFRLLTKGDYDVISLEGLDEKNGRVYFIASPENPTQRYLYQVSLKGGEAIRVSPAHQSGTHQYEISPNAQYAIHTFSSFGKPPIRNLIRLPDHKVIRHLAHNDDLKKAVEKLDRMPVEFFRIDIGNDVQLDAWMMFPPKFVKQKKHPLLIFVYGEPAGQTVLDRWGGKRYLWHLMHTQKGYFVISIDNRGTPSPRGRDWRKGIYRQIGILAPKDQADALNEILKDRPYLDSDRVGIWGWSGGGSMTLNMMFKYPDQYHVGMAIAPVPNQRLYDTIYQERYMGLPKDNVDGFREGSPLFFANHLKGDLLIIHGTGDDNVHYQGTEMLINELISLGKEFDMMSYPNRTHSIGEGLGTRSHLYDLLTRYLYEHLPTK